MRLSEYTDYTLRVLMCCAAHTDRLLTIAEIAQALQLSKNHLMKIVNDLAHQGLLDTTRGRGGGIRLSKPATGIRVGEVVRASETDFRLVECFDADTDTCTLTPRCRLRGALRRALNAYFAELDGLTLADIASPRKASTGLAEVRVVAAPTRGLRPPASARAPGRGRS